MEKVSVAWPTRRAVPALWGNFVSLFSSGNILPLSVSFLAASIIVIKIGSVVWISFLQGLHGADSAATLDNYRAVLASAGYFEILFNTLIVGAGTVLVNLFFAVPMAWLVYRTNVPFKASLVSLIAIGIAIPGYLKSIGWILLLSPQVGLINALFMQLFNLDQPPFNIYGLHGVVFIQGLMLTPLMFFLIAGAMHRLDPALEEAAEVCGARKVRTIWRVSGPLILPAIAGGAIYNLMIAVNIYDVAALIAAPARVEVVATLIFNTVKNPDVGLPQYGVASVYGIFLILPLLVALHGYSMVMKHGFKYGVVTGKGYRPKIIDLGGFKYLGLGFVLFYILLAVVFPFIALVWTSFLPYIQLPSRDILSVLTLDAYRSIPAALGGFKPIMNTMILITSAPLICLFISLMISWVSVRLYRLGGQVLDVIVMLPLAFPGVVVGVVILYLVLRYIQPLYGTLLLLILVEAFAMITYGTRILNAALVQVHKELEEAAYITGARQLKVLRRIVAPLIVPSLFLGGFWMMMMTFRNVTTALLFYSPQNVVLSVTIWNLWDRLETGNIAAALGVIVTVILLVLVFLIQKLGGRQLSLYSSH